MSLRILLLLVTLFALSPAARAAANAQPITPLLQSVAGGESQVFSVRFTDAAGRPAAGETVSFANDACGAFPNGLFLINVTADANGVASTTFTARPQGIVCWLTVSAGVSVTYNVLTYIPSSVYLNATTNPAEVRPGEPFSVSAAAMQGVYRLFNVDIAARIVPGTASASITPGSGNTGQSGMVGFTVNPDGCTGDYAVELQWRNLTQRLAIHASTTPWQDMWWSGPAENGWGMSIVQHGDTLFSVIYAYDAAGHPTWFVMPGGAWNAEKTVYSGNLYLPRGSPYAAYDTSKFVVGASVGHAALTFTDSKHVALDYTINGIDGHKLIERQPFGPQDTASGLTVGDMWWGGDAQNGWGIAVLQQFRTLFSVWFTYDPDGSPTWFVMPQGFWSDAQTYEGRIYRAAGSPWLGHDYNAAALRLTDAGSFKMRFTADNASFEYLIDGKAGSLPFRRQPF